MCVALALELLVVPSVLKFLPRDGGKQDLEAVKGFLARAPVCLSVWGTVPVMALNLYIQSAWLP